MTPLPVPCCPLQQSPAEPSTAAAAGLEDLTDGSARSTPGKQPPDGEPAAGEGEPAAKRRRASPTSSSKGGQGACCPEGRHACMLHASFWHTRDCLALLTKPRLKLYRRAAAESASCAPLHPAGKGGKTSKKEGSPSAAEQAKGVAEAVAREIEIESEEVRPQHLAQIGLRASASPALLLLLLLLLAPMHIARLRGVQLCRRALCSCQEPEQPDMAQA